MLFIEINELMVKVIVFVGNLDWKEEINKFIWEELENLYFF